MRNKARLWCPALLCRSLLKMRKPGRYDSPNGMFCAPSNPTIYGMHSQPPTSEMKQHTLGPMLLSKGLWIASRTHPVYTYSDNN